MKGIIIYKSKYGSTKQYALWIQKELGFDLYDYKTAPINHLDQYDVIIFGSNIMVFKLTLNKYINNIWEKIKNKKVVLFTVSSSDPELPVIKRIIRSSLNKTILKNMKTFSFQGRYIFKQMNFFDRVLINLAAILEKNPVIKKGLLTEIDNVNKDFIEPLISYVKK